MTAQAELVRDLDQILGALGRLRTGIEALDLPPPDDDDDDDEPPPDTTGGWWRKGKRSGLPWNSGECGEIGRLVKLRGGLGSDIRTCWGPREDWQDLGSGEIFTKSGHLRGAAKGEIIDFCTPFVPESGGGKGVFRDIADGKHDDVFAGMAKAAYRLWQDRGYAAWIFRCNWECNGGWYDHAVAEGQLADYRRALIRVAGILRKHCRGCWISQGVARDGNRYDNSLLFPSERGVLDGIGVSAYSGKEKTAAALERWLKAEARGGPIGVLSWADFAQSRGLWCNLSEWGLRSGSGSGNETSAGGAKSVDNPEFMRAMNRVFRSGAIIAECYLEGERHGLVVTKRHPGSRAVYAQLWH